ncbi:flavodoxin family protein [Eubacterium aggregans]|uniref:flavodoxin family protein n=1 Tax=Eubacterium aggregans TaxID=81409 RepID=UPI0023F0CA11|nr:flavodoxin family protein [Eubacterium aggregans]MDD4692759.1 flavodoxin family protein [Eubacterium aggregans]
MKVLLVNGSPHPQGCTATALAEVAKSLESRGIESHSFWLGKEPISGCLGCGACRKTGKCFIDDPVNVFVKEAAQYDGFIFGSPVHFAGASSALSAFMDRAFFIRFGNNSPFAGKPGAAVVSCRRGGASSAFDQINKYFTITGMPVVSSQYWNQVHGTTPEEVVQDAEGMQTMRTLGNNMAWLLLCIEIGKAVGLTYPEQEPAVFTNFIR